MRKPSCRPASSSACSNVRERPARPAGDVYDIQRPADRRKALRRIPALTRGALGLVWRASRRRFLTTVGLQAASAAALGAQLLIARELLTRVIQDDSAASLVPALGALVGMTSLLGAWQPSPTTSSGYSASWSASTRSTESLACRAQLDVDAFETPTFYDQLERARTAGKFRPVEIVTSITTMTMGILSSIGIAVVFATFEPLLVPLVALVALPVLLATLYSSKQAYAFEYAMTPESRERAYLMELLTGRDTAKELRTFAATRFLRSRYDALTLERLNRLRESCGAGCSWR